MRKMTISLLLIINCLFCFAEMNDLHDTVTGDKIRVYIKKEEKTVVMYFPDSEITEISDFSFGDNIERLEINDAKFQNYDLKFLKKFKNLKSLELWGVSIKSLGFLNYIPSIQSFTTMCLEGNFQENLIIDLEKYADLVMFSMTCSNEHPITIQKVSHINKNLKYLILINVHVNDPSCFLELKKQGNKDLKFDLDSDVRFNLYGKIPFLEEKDLRAIDGVYHLHLFEN